MKIYSAEVTAVLNGNEVPLVTMVKMTFPSGVIAMNASNYTFTFGGAEYRAANGLGQISAVSDGRGDPGGIKFEVMNFDASFLSLALDDVDEVQGSPVEIRTGILDPATHEVLAAPLDWAGYCDTMTTGEDAKTGSIAVSAENKAVDLMRGNPLVYNTADHETIYPGDKYFQYVESQTDQPVVWPDRKWFYK